MCICAIAWRIFEDKPLVILANRDEFFDRPTAPLHHWQQSPILAGQDLTAGGTWLGVNPNNSRWAIILNFREMVANKPSFSTSRGQIISDFLVNDLSPLDFARGLDLVAFDGFNLVIGDDKQAVLLNNKGVPISLLANGLYVLSNGQPTGFEKVVGQNSHPHDPHDDWFKNERLRQRVRQEILPLIAAEQDFVTASFAVLADTQQAPPDRLPQTGLPDAAEMSLSSIFIPTNRHNGVTVQPYGTRCSSVLWLDNGSFNKQGFNFYEKTFAKNGESFIRHFSP